MEDVMVFLFKTLFYIFHIPALVLNIMWRSLFLGQAFLKECKIYTK